MQTFLQELAKDIVKEHSSRLGEVTVIFPNRRAGLFFREYLKAMLDKPTWSPQVLSFQDFIATNAPFQKADPLYLVHRLFQVYSKILKTKEGFDRFYYWGQMLIKDFDDIDKYLVNAQNLYTNLSRQKQLDLSFDFLLPGQKEIIQRFWQGFEESKSLQKERFEFVWNHLFAVYRGFRTSLQEEGLAYEGMQYRHIAENLDNTTFRGIGKIIQFAGFNALNTAEEKVITWCIEKLDARILWDLDGYYFLDRDQEAGYFLRQYKEKPIFATSFPSSIPSRLQDDPRSMTITGVPQHIGQAKVLGQKLEELITSDPKLDIRKVAVVLADEALLFPVLHSLPAGIESVNVTMGFPLSYAPVNSLVEHLLELQRMVRTDPDGHLLFHFKPTLAIIRHPLIIQTAPKLLEDWTREIQANNKVFITLEEFPKTLLVQLIFKVAKDDLVRYLSDILLELHGLSQQEKSRFEAEYVHLYYQLLNRYADLLTSVGSKTDLRSFSALFKQLIRTERLPFTGEPLRGLQVMGVLETRNLDFEHVFVLSMNEDFFPAQSGKHSFIPYNLRKAYNLPNYDQQDAIYAYLFYRLIQRAGNVNFFYNTEGNDLGGEEMSRFLQQLLNDPDLKIKSEVLANFTSPGKPAKITITKNEAVMGSLRRYWSENGQPAKRLSPSALNTYLDCRLRFYFRYVANLYEPGEMEEDVDARSLGNVLHHAMEVLYSQYLERKKTSILEKSDFAPLRKGLEEAAIAAFRKQFAVAPGRKFYFEGKNIIAKEIIKDFMLAILRVDETYAPFEVVGMEAEYTMDLALENRLEYNHKETPSPGEHVGHFDPGKGKVGLRGTIDRIDRKEDQVRLIDYKTGQDKHVFNSMEELFDRKKKNKAALQTFNYALLYQQVKREEDILVPAVFNKDALFMGEDVLLEMKGKGKVKNAAHFLDEYSQQLQNLLQEIFDPQTPFDQTEDLRKCAMCAYKDICGR